MPFLPESPLLQIFVARVVSWLASCILQKPINSLWGGGGQTKKNTSTDGMAAQTIVTTGVALCGQDKPTQDMALYTRVIFLAFTKTSFNQQEKRHYEESDAMDVMEDMANDVGSASNNPVQEELSF